jgi:hypothetical protein
MGPKETPFSAAEKMTKFVSEGQTQKSIFLRFSAPIKATHFGVNGAEKVNRLKSFCGAFAGAEEGRDIGND